jgi:hypothetical protein
MNAQHEKMLQRRVAFRRVTCIPWKRENNRTERMSRRSSPRRRRGTGTDPLVFALHRLRACLGRQACGTSWHQRCKKQQVPACGRRASHCSPRSEERVPFLRQGKRDDSVERMATRRGASRGQGKPAPTKSEPWSQGFGTTLRVHAKWRQSGVASHSKNTKSGRG